MRGWKFLACAAAVAASAALGQETGSSPSLDDQIKAEDLRTKQLANDEAERANREKKRKELLDALPSGGTSGAITVKDGAGQAEANALAAGAAFKLARLIAGEVHTAAALSPSNSGVAQTGAPCDRLPMLNEVAAAAPPPPAPASDETQIEPRTIVPVLLVSGTEALAFGRWDQFRFRSCKIANDYSDEIPEARKTAGELLDILPRQAGGTALTGGATALSAAVKLAQLVTPDWEVASLQTTVSNRAFLLEVARAYRALESDRSARPIYWQGAVSKLGASSRLFEALNALGRTNGEAEEAVKVLADLIAKGEKILAAKEPPPPAGLEAKVKEAKARKASLDAVIASHAALVKDLFGGDATSPLPIAGVISESAAANLLGSRGIVVSLNVDSTGGTSASRKVIWNAFDPGSPPLFISGTVGVSYAAVRASDQEMLTHGAYICSTGPVKLRRVPAVVNPGGSLSCAAK